ncbi:MAG: STAS domain-containing protein [Butyrivibrio sp.]|nr:STAS domain-containing protein [Butyrivibrio sp.]
MQVDYEKLIALYKKDGMLVEKVPYYRDDLELRLFSSMSPEEIERLKENMKHVNIWKVTVDPEFKDDAGASRAVPVDPNLPFEVTEDLNEGTFNVSIQGRMDTLTAPQLLKYFNEAKEGGDITEIKVDVSRMPYVSSAGLRVLLMMYKSLQDKDKFEMTGVSENVRDIFETTGFDEFFLKD